MRYLPVAVDTREKKVLILGGGKASLRKLKSLLKTEFLFYLISDTFLEEFFELQEAHPDRIKMREQKINLNFQFYGYDYVLIGTNDRQLNEALETFAKSHDQMYLRLDQGGESAFHLAQVIEKNHMILSLFSEVPNPTVSKIIGRDIENFMDRYDGEKIQILGDIRNALVRKNSDRVGEIIEELWHEEKFRVDAYWKEMKENENTDWNQGE